jgi:pterin-4a-carbinolamine dehydratase
MSCKIDAPWAKKWDFRESPCQMTRKFHFSAYRETTQFLDYLNELIKALDVHPHNINFGSTYATVTIEGEGDSIDSRFIDMARQLSERVDVEVS